MELEFTKIICARVFEVKILIRKRSNEVGFKKGYLFAVLVQALGM